MNRYIGGIFLITIVSAVSLAALVLGFDPYSAPPLIRASFFAALFLALWGLATVAWSALSVVRRTGTAHMLGDMLDMDVADFSKAFRRGGMVAVIATMPFLLIRVAVRPQAAFIVLLLLAGSLEIWLHTRAPRQAQTEDVI